jgi:hypothetical protein
MVCAVFFLHYAFHYDWHDGFFKHLNRNQLLDHYRLVQFAPQLTHQKNNQLIGDDLPSVQWINALTTFLEKIEVHDLKKIVSVELILDSQQTKYYQSVLDLWITRFSDRLKITSLASLIDQYKDQEPLLNDCHEFNQELCKNLVRLYHLHQKKDPPGYDTHAIIDADFFAQLHPGILTDYFHTKNHPMRSETLFGLDRSKKNVYVLWRIIPDSLYAYESFIVDDADDLTFNIVKTNSKVLIRAYEHPLKQLTERKKLVHQSFAQYQEHLQERVAWWKTHPTLNFSERSLLHSLSGDKFWLDLCWRGIAGFSIIIPEHIGFVWPEKKVHPSLAYDNLSYIFDEHTADSVLKVILTTHDITYFQDKQVDWLPQLLSYHQLLWDTLSDQQQHEAMMLSYDLQRFYKERN